MKIPKIGLSVHVGRDVIIWLLAPVLLANLNFVCFVKKPDHIKSERLFKTDDRVYITFHLKPKQTIAIIYANQLLNRCELTFENNEVIDRVITRAITTDQPISLSYETLPIRLKQYYFNHYIFIALPGDTLKLSLKDGAELDVSQCNPKNVISNGDNPYYYDGGFKTATGNTINWDEGWRLYEPFFESNYGRERLRIANLFRGQSLDSVVRRQQFEIAQDVHYYKRIFDWVWQKDNSYYQPASHFINTKLSRIEELLNSDHLFLSNELFNVIDGTVKLKILLKGQDFNNRVNVYNEAVLANIGKFKKAYLANCILTNPICDGEAFNEILNDFKKRYYNDTFLISRIDSVIDKRNKAVFLTGSIKLSTISGQTVALSKITKNKRYTVIDFWASWCLPCREQLSYWDSIRKQMVGYDVNFISINLDEKVTNWELASKAEAKHLSSNNFRLNAIDKKSVIKMLSIGSIPRYIVLDGTKIISMDFYQPTDASFKNELLTIIK